MFQSFRPIGTRLHENDKQFPWTARANRSGEQLLGIRLLLMVIDPNGKLRSRITWTERADCNVLDQDFRLSS